MKKTLASLVLAGSAMLSACSTPKVKIKEEPKEIKYHRVLPMSDLVEAKRPYDGLDVYFYKLKKPQPNTIYVGGF